MLRPALPADPAAPLRAAALGWAGEARAVLARLDAALVAQEAALVAGADPSLPSVSLDRLLSRLAEAQAAAGLLTD